MDRGVCDSIWPGARTLPRPTAEDKIHVGVYIYTYTCACAYIYTYKWNIYILCSWFGFNPSATSLFVHFYLISRPLLPFSSCATSHSVVCYPFHSLPPHSLSFSAFLSVFCHLTFRLLCYRLMLLPFVFCHPLFFLSYLIFRPLPPPISSSATLSRPKLPIFFVLCRPSFRPLLPPFSSPTPSLLVHCSRHLTMVDVVTFPSFFRSHASIIFE